MAGTVYFSRRRKKPGHDLVGKRVPLLSAGIEFHGEYQGSGFTNPQYLARRGDGQAIQLSHLLYLVATEINGTRDIADIARRVSLSYGRSVSVDNIDYLLTNQLRSLGVVSDHGADGGQNVLRTNNLLTLVGKRVLLPQRAVCAIARALTWAHHPTVVIPVLLSLVLFDIWLFGSIAAVNALVTVATDPPMMLAVLVLSLASLLFHEFGHASACHYSGATPGAIGFGIYLVWPALYTDVTDVYRANKAGRLRTDLGGVYFNVIFILVMAVCFGMTGHHVFLAVAFFNHLEILEQLLPIVRLDGYFILGDLAGVPDLFGKVIPILLSVFRRRTDDPRVANLKRGTRLIVTAWVLTVCPLLAANFLYAICNLPRILNATLISAASSVTALRLHWAGHLYASVALDAISLVFLALPTLGLFYLLIRMVSQGARKLLSATEHRPRLRVALIALSFLASLSTVALWIHTG